MRDKHRATAQYSRKAIRRSIARRPSQAGDLGYKSAGEQSWERYGTSEHTRYDHSFLLNLSALPLSERADRLERMRVRFAPSPTGELHLGGARAALYNWLLARQSGGSLILRIEDTDLSRSKPEHVEPDPGRASSGWVWTTMRVRSASSPGASITRPRCAGLLESGHAYHCNAGQEEVKAYKEEHGAGVGFRGTAESSGAVRLRVPDSGITVVHDLIRGETGFPNRSMDEPVIARADGSLLYNFAVAVDDLEMGITHVVRGEDHLSNTPKQLLVLEALGASPPLYAHLPLLHGSDGKKLSKRHGAASLQQLREAGILPEAARNYLALLGWGPSDNQTLLSTEELIGQFNLASVSSNPAQFDEQKLRWMNGLYLRALSLDELTARVEEFTGRSGLRAGVEISREKIQTLADFWPLAGFLFTGPADDPTARAKWLDEAGLRALKAAEVLGCGTSILSPPSRSGALLEGLAIRLELKPKQVFQALRVAIAGRAVSPGLFESLEALGREESLLRIGRALARAEAVSVP